MNDEPIFPVTLTVLAVMCCAGAIAGMSRLSGWRDRALAVRAGAVIFAAMFFATMRALAVPQEPWNVNRLAVTVSLVKGYRLYYPPDEGPIENHIYGPMATLAYLPATAAKTPTNALLIAAALAAMWFFIPAAWLLARASRASWIARAAAFGCFGCIIAGSAGLSRVASWNHADAPSLGLCAGAAAMILRRRDQTDPPIVSWIFSSIFAVLAVWSKQTAAPILLVLPLWIAMREGFRTGAKYLAMIAIIGVLISGARVFAFGPRAIWFNMVVEPSHHPWQFTIPHTLKLLAGECFVPAMILIAGAILRTKARLMQADWMLALLIALAMLPTATLGWIKQGGTENNAAYVTYFLLIAACSALAECEAPRFLAGRPDQLFAGRVAILVLGGLFALRAHCDDARFSEHLHFARQPHHNLAETAYRYELAHPGEAYFPWDTLAPLLASGRLDHFDFGVHDRILAEFPPSPEHLRAYLPPKMRLIAIPTEPTATCDMLTLLPEFSRVTKLDELHGFTIFQRPDDTKEKP